MLYIKESEKYQIPVIFVVNSDITRDIRAHCTIYYKTLPIKRRPKYLKAKIGLRMEAKILMNRSRFNYEI